MNRKLRVISIFFVLILGVACSVYAENLAITMFDFFTGTSDSSISMGGGGY